MKTIFHAMEPKILGQFIETKKELLEIAGSMSAKERAEGRKEIMEAATLYDVPAELDDHNELFSIGGDGVAIIPIAGKLTSQADICDGFFSDCTTYGFIQAATVAADANPSVKEIKYHISSGGGHVTGVDACGQVMAMCSKKTTAVVFGMAASAAYWLACQCDLIEMSSPTDFVGSIGVAVEIIDSRKREESAGIKRIVLTSTDAPDKRLDLATEEGQDKLVEELDAIHEVFASRVSYGRGVSLETINSDFGQGGLVIASLAKKVGMVDSISNEILAGNSPMKKTTPAAAGKPEKEATKMSLQATLAADPAMKAEYDVLIASAKAEGVTEGKTLMESAFTAAIPILSSASYPKNVKDRVLTKAQAGDVEGLQDFVAMHDMNVEGKNGEKAEGEGGTETPPAAPAAATPPGKTGLIASQEDVVAAAADMKEG